MKKKFIKIMLLIIFLIILFSNNFIYAADINLGDYRPEIQAGTRVIEIIASLLNVLITLGVVGTAVAIALIGFNSILGSASEKAEVQHKLVGIVIAVVMITSGSIFARFIISIAESI